MTSSASAAAPGQRRWLAKVLVPLVIVVCLAGFVVAGNLADTDENGVVGSGAVEAVIPTINAKVVRQDTVGADLSVGYQGRLRINDIDIPPEQLIADNGLNVVMFKPGPGKVLTELRPNRNCAEITFWQIQDGPQSAGLPLRWCFDAV